MVSALLRVQPSGRAAPWRRRPDAAQKLDEKPGGLFDVLYR
jgi:hypothetical protein